MTAPENRESGIEASSPRSDGSHDRSQESMRENDFYIISRLGPSASYAFTEQKAFADGGKSFIDVPHLYTDFHPHTIRAGFLQKRRTVTGFFSRRMVEVSGGKITWTKPDDLSSNSFVSCRSLAGSVVRILKEGNRFVKNGADQHVFIVYLAYDTRKFTIAPLIFAAESEYDMKKWIHAIRLASGWLYQPPCLVAFPQRLCGLLLVEIISVDNILAADWNGKSDPYVIVEFDGLLARTATHYETLTTFFNQIVTLPVYNDDPNTSINFMIFDEDSLKTHDLLGGITVPLHSLGFNKEVVWDSVPLRALKGSVGGKSIGSDQFGTISFRTLYRSSKVTQLLPLHQIPTVMEEGARSVSIASQRMSLDQYPKSQHTFDRRTLTSPASIEDMLKTVVEDSSASETEADLSPRKSSQKDSSFSPKSIKSDDSTPSSPTSSPKAKSSSQDDSQKTDEGYEFSIEMFKKQLQRIVAIFKIFEIFSSIGYFFSWRDPKWTLLMYSWITWVFLVHPESSLMFFFVFILKLVVQSHPNFGDLKLEIQSSWHEMRARVTGIQYSRSKTSPADFPDEYRVYECQRRKIAGAMTIVSTMVKVTTVVPAQMAVHATTAVAAPLLAENSQGEDRPMSPVAKATATAQEAKKELENLFLNFSAKNLRKETESEWVSSCGIALEESPSTVVDGIKIKWHVMVKTNVTDKNGWEYARNFPSLSTLTSPSRSMIHDARSVAWGSGHFSSRFKLHRHWVRRRVWIGKPIRAAFDSEEPIKLSDVVSSMDDNSAETLLEKEKKRRSLYAKFWQLMDEGRKLQNILFGLASQLESIKNLFTWKSRWITSMIFWAIMIVLMASLIVPQFAFTWLIITFILVDHMSDVQRKMKLTKPLVEVLKKEVLSSNIPPSWKEILNDKLSSYFSKMDEIYLEVSVSVLCSMFQRACDKLWFPGAVKLTLNDFEISSSGGPVVLGDVLEKIYLLANHGDADWWKSIKVSIHPKNLIKGHLVSDWEEYDPNSVFTKTH